MTGSTNLITTDSTDTVTVDNPKVIKMNAKTTSLLASKEKLMAANKSL